jgi:uncharacterized protein
VLREPRYPVHQIADRLLPYLRVLVEQFHPQQVILFGSYAYGYPNEHSDVDLLIIMCISTVLRFGKLSPSSKLGNPFALPLAASLLTCSRFTRRPRTAVVSGRRILSWDHSTRTSACVKTDETNPKHWFLLAEERLRMADALFASQGIS